MPQLFVLTAGAPTRHPFLRSGSIVRFQTAAARAGVQFAWLTSFGSLNVRSSLFLRRTDLSARQLLST